MRRKSRPPLIVIVNDDGIKSPGLRAAARAMTHLGQVLIVAPRDQQTSMGRAFIGGGVARPVSYVVNGKRMRAYAVAASPAVAVRYALLICADRAAALVVSGINYGENIGNGVSISGTIGAALEAANMGVPALAVSLALETRYHLSHSKAIDFSVAEHFAEKVARRILARGMPHGADVVSVNVPQGAQRTTPWRWTRVSRRIYYRSIFKDTPRGKVLEGYESDVDPLLPEPDSDVRAVALDHVVSISPLTLDLTAHVPRKELERWMK